MIPGLPQVGPMELLIILAVVLLFFGAKRIPELARSLGRGTREFRQGISEVATEVETQEVDRQENNEVNPPLDEAARAESSRAEADTVHAKQKS